MTTTASCQFDSNKSDSAISTSFSNDEFTSYSTPPESSSSESSSASSSSASAAASNSSNQSEENNVSSSSQAEIECSSSTSSASSLSKSSSKNIKLPTSNFVGNDEKVEETSLSSSHSSTHSVAGESEVSSTTSGSVCSVRTSLSSIENGSNGTPNQSHYKPSQWLYSGSDYSSGRACIFQAPFLSGQNQQQHHQQAFYFYTPYQNNTNNQPQQQQNCYCYAYNQNANQLPFYYYPSHQAHHSQQQHHHHQQQSFYCYQPYNQHHQQQLLYPYAFQQHQPVVFLSPPPPQPPHPHLSTTHHHHPHHAPQTQFATIVPYATTPTTATLPAVPITSPSTSNQPHLASLIHPVANNHQTHHLAPTAHPQVHPAFNPIAHASSFTIPIASSMAVASGPVSGSPVIAFSQLKLGYNLISLLPIDAQAARVRQAYGMDKVWHDEFEQLFSQFISNIVWALIEVETMPKIRNSSGNASSNISSSSNNNNNNTDNSSTSGSIKSSSSSDSGVAQVDDSTSGVGINEGGNGSNKSCSSCCSSENDSSDSIEQRSVDNNREQTNEDTDSNSSPSFDSKPTKIVSPINHNHENLHEFNSNQTKYPTRFRVFIDSAKVRFCCDNCGHGWTSMKGRVVFWYELFELTTANNNTHNLITVFNAESPNNINSCHEAVGIANNTSNYLMGYVAYKLFGQQCDICKIENRFERPMWYPEEVTKVLNNLYNKIGQIYFGFEMPGIDKQRRAGKPKTSHNSSLCQACHDGVCTDRK